MDSPAHRKNWHSPQHRMQAKYQHKDPVRLGEWR